MKLCGKCGNNVNDDTKFCPICGNEMDNQQAQPVNQTGQNDFTAKFTNLNNTADTTADFDNADIEQNKFMGILAYFSWLVLIPIFAAPNSKFARYHANQGLILAITEVIWWIGTVIINTMFFAINWRLGYVVGTILALANIVFVVLLIIGIMNAANGKAKELPVIGKFRIIK